MALTIDGSGATAIANGTSLVAAAITTPSANDIIIAFVHCEQSISITVSSVSGGGLTWARRKQYAFLGISSRPQTIEIWWAAAASPLTAQTITATFSGTIDDCSLQLIAVNGAGSLTSPWDVDVSLPSTGVVSGSGNYFVNVSTSAAGTILLGLLGSGSANNGAAGTGFTNLYTTTNAGGTQWSYTRSEYQLFATAQTNYSASFLSTGAGFQGVVFDAISITAAGGGGGTSAQARVMVMA